MIGHIDEPSTNSIINSNPFICRGWTYAECGIASIEIRINDREVGTATYGLLRNDVKKEYPQYSGIEKSGFFFSKKIHMMRGSHILKVTVFDREGNKKDLGEVEFRTVENFFHGFVSTIFPWICSNTAGSSESLDTRKRISYCYLKGEGIEIGALHNPLSINNQTKVKYVDRFPSDELIKHYSDLNPHKMVKIDIIDNGEILSTIPDNSLDFIIANHFLEHCENPLGTIRNHLKKIKRGGVIYYAIPDKSNTFDKERSLTTFNHLIDDDIQSPEKSRKDHFQEWVMCVEKTQDHKEINSRISALMAINYSIHYHVWDSESFFEFIYRAIEYLEKQFFLLHFECGKNEIICILKKRE